MESSVYELGGSGEPCTIPRTVLPSSAFADASYPIQLRAAISATPTAFPLEFHVKIIPASFFRNEAS